MRLRLFLDCIVPLVCAAVFAGEKGETPPVIIRQVPPGYGAELSKSYMVDSIKVEMIIDPNGVPFLLSTTDGIPDNVVEALAQWRYRPGKKDGREAAFAIMLTVPVRTAIDSRVERSLRRSWRPTKELAEALKIGEQLDAAGAARVEQRLEADPNSLEARAILLAWGAIAGAVADRDQACKFRAGQIAFLVQNAPEAEILGSPLAIINAAADPLQDAAGYEQVRRLWLDQLALNPGKPAIIAHAVNFLRLQDPEKTEQVLLSAVNEIQGASVWLGDLDGLAALGVTSLDLKSGLPVVGRRTVTGNDVRAEGAKRISVHRQRTCAPVCTRDGNSRGPLPSDRGASSRRVCRFLPGTAAPRQTNLSGHVGVVRYVNFGAGR